MSGIFDFLTNVGTSFVQAKYGPNQYPPYTQPTWGMSDMPIIGGLFDTDQNGQVHVGPDGQPIPKGYYWSSRANCGRGGLVKYRRRRRPLLTPAEAGQLQTLMSIAGKNSDVTKTWIATRRR